VCAVLLFKSCTSLFHLKQNVGATHEKQTIVLIYSTKHSQIKTAQQTGNIVIPEALLNRIYILLLEIRCKIRIWLIYNRHKYNCHYSHPIPWHPHPLPTPIFVAFFSAFARPRSADPPWCGLAENHLKVQALLGVQDLTAAIVTVCWTCPFSPGTAGLCCHCLLNLSILSWD